MRATFVHPEVLDVARLGGARTGELQEQQRRATLQANEHQRVQRLLAEELRLLRRIRERNAGPNGRAFHRRLGLWALVRGQAGAEQRAAAQQARTQELQRTARSPRAAAELLRQLQEDCSPAPAYAAGLWGMYEQGSNTMTQEDAKTLAPSILETNIYPQRQYVAPQQWALDDARRIADAFQKMRGRVTTTPAPVVLVPDQQAKDQFSAQQERVLREAFEQGYEYALRLADMPLEEDEVDTLATHKADAVAAAGLAELNTQAAVIKDDLARRCGL